MKIVYIGDIYGALGLEALDRFLPTLKREHPHHILIMNGENSADGLGIRLKEYKHMMQAGAHAVVLGNHAFSKQELFEFIDDAKIIRPLNYPKGTPGKGCQIIRHNQHTVAILQVMGRVFMHDPLDNPFEALDQALESLEADVKIVDVHAETTSEKLALAHHLDGRVDAVFGTHTHVQTNDAMRLPKGTFYLTDVGMTGAKFGILGADRQTVMNKFKSGMPLRLFPETERILQLNAVLVDLEAQTIQTLHYSDSQRNDPYGQRL